MNIIKDYTLTEENKKLFFRKLKEKKLFTKFCVNCAAAYCNPRDYKFGSKNLLAAYLDSVVGFYIDHNYLEHYLGDISRWKTENKSLIHY